MNELMESEEFCTGILVGLHFYQQKIIMAHEQKEPLSIAGEQYYVQNGQEMLKQVIDKICE